MRLRTLLLSIATLALTLAVFVACSGEPVIEDIDAGVTDAGGTPSDGGAKADAGNQPPADAGNGASDAGKTDAGTGNDDAGTVEDDAGLTDAGVLPGVKCGSVQCAEGEVCCVDSSGGGVNGTCASSCPDGGSVLNCDGPEDCAGSGGICCGELKTGAGTPPNCPISSAKSDCASSCTTSINIGCGSTNTVRMCHLAADCAAEPSAKFCCTFEQGANEVTFCVPSIFSAYAKSCAQ